MWTLHTFISTEPAFLWCSFTVSLVCLLAGVCWLSFYLSYLCECIKMRSKITWCFMCCCFHTCSHTHIGKSANLCRWYERGELFNHWTVLMTTIISLCPCDQSWSAFRASLMLHQLSWRAVFACGHKQHFSIFFQKETLLLELIDREETAGRANWSPPN